MEIHAQNGLRNRILRSLPEQDLALLQPLASPINLNFRPRLQSANRRVKDVYFLDSGMASVVAVAQGSGSQTEVGLIGCEGFVGLPIVLRAERSPCEIFIQVEGRGVCMSAYDFCSSPLQKSEALQDAALRFAHVFGVQMAYTALANAHGKVEERLARWLLMAQDRIADDELLLTHEFLALMLGVRRAGVTVALQHFVQSGLIETARGCVVIKDRDGLEESANGLYGSPEAEFERLFPRAYAQTVSQ
jgi:CRP-like cAMP-binding protein